MQGLVERFLVMKPQAREQAVVGMARVAQAMSQRLPVSPTFIKFLIVGAIGYLVNQLTLFLAYDSPVFFFLPAQDTDFHFLGFTHPDIRLFIASVTAVEVSIVSNFYWHERWTFRDRERHSPTIVRFLKFNGTSLGSPLIVLATVNVLTPAFGISPYIANTIGILVGFTWNWLCNTLVIWPR
jgi:putative flippase GtrA